MDSEQNKKLNINQNQENAYSSNQGGYTSEQAFQGQGEKQNFGQNNMQAPQPNGNMFAFVENPVQELANSISAIVKQKVELLEALTGCETKNRYHVFATNSFGQTKHLFKCKEKSGCCVRNFCPSGDRPFNMIVKHVLSQNDMDDDFSKVFSEFHRPFKCTCCCLNRPEMKAEFHNTKEYFGKVIERFTCCDPIICVYDKDNFLKYRITADCCQCGFVCRSTMCGKLSSVKFTIHEGSTDFKGKPVGEITKKSEGLQELFTDADTFRIVFPIAATPEEKLMLIAAVLMIDYRFYEDNGEDDGKRKGRGRGRGGLRIRF